MSPTNVQQEWARTLLWSLADAGIRQVVISPGSRSTPFVLAALEHPDLDCIDFLDERVAAFYALGQARASGRASLLICTSGTAGANYLPAVVEAGADYVPLLVLTADRPLELTDCGANQTIDQQRLFGQHARRFFDLGMADAAPEAFAGLRRRAAQAVHATTYPEPGAVQLNARARKPLEPARELAEPEIAFERLAEDLRSRPIVTVATPNRLPSDDTLCSLADQLCRAERPLVVCGPAPIGGAASVAGHWPAGAWLALPQVVQDTGAVLLAETASQQRFASLPEMPRADAFDTILRSSAAQEALAADFVLQLGRTPTSAAWPSYLKSCAAPHWVLAEHGWNDPSCTAERLLIGEPEAALEWLAELLDEDRQRPFSVPPLNAWQTAWHRADQLAWGAVDASLAAVEGLSEGAVARQLVTALPDGALLALGNSLPIRHLDTYCPGRPVAWAVWSQRGASGIDGVISGSAGAASVLRRPAALLIGDVSFLHDAGGLAAAARIETPFVVLVIHNQGGRIFEQLPLAGHPAAAGHLTHWTIPHDRRLEPAATLHGLPYRQANSLQALQEALAEAFARPGATVVEARVSPRDAAERRRDIDRRFAAAWHSA